MLRIIQIASGAILIGASYMFWYALEDFPDCNCYAYSFMHAHYVLAYVFAKAFCIWGAIMGLAMIFAPLWYAENAEKGG